MFRTNRNWGVVWEKRGRELREIQEDLRETNRIRKREKRFLVRN